MSEKGTVAVKFVGDIKELAASVGETDGLFAKFGKGAALGVGAIATAAVGAGTALFEIGEKFEKSFNSIRVQTGATDEQMKGLEESFKKVTASTPASFDDIAKAVGTVNQKLGLTGKPLDDLSTQILNLSRITKTDLGENVSAVTGVFNNWNVATGDQKDQLDLLYRASQASGVSVASIASTMAAAGPKLREAGLGFEESASLVALLGKNGIDATTVMGPLGKAIAAAAKKGEDAGKVIGDAFADIKSKSEVLGNDEALKLFGTKGIAMAGMIREGKLSYDDFMQSLLTGKDTIGKASAATLTLHDKMNLLKNQALVTLEPIAMKVVDAVTKLVDWFSKLSPQVQIAVVVAVALTAGLGPLIAIITNVSTVVKLLGGALEFLAANPVVLIIAAVVALGVGLYELYQHSEKFRDIVNAAFSVVSGAAQAMASAAVAAFDWIKSHIDLILVVALGPLGVAIVALKDNWSTVWDAVSGAVADAWSIIQPILKTMGDALSKVGGAISTVTGAASKAGGFVTGALGAIGLASGGNVTHGGWAVVGEKGPELVDLPGGATVYPHGQGPGGGTTINVYGMDDTTAKRWAGVITQKQQFAQIASGVR